MDTDEDHGMNEMPTKDGSCAAVVGNVALAKARGTLTPIETGEHPPDY